MADQNNADNGAQAQQEAGAQSQQAQQTEQSAAQGTDNGAQAQQSTQTQSAPPAGNTVNAHKHQRDIAKLEAERDAARAEAEGYKGLKAEFDAWKAEQAAAKAEDALKAAGCIDVVAASARLSEFDGDVEKLKGPRPTCSPLPTTARARAATRRGPPTPRTSAPRRCAKCSG